MSAEAGKPPAWLIGDFSLAANSAEAMADAGEIGGGSELTSELTSGNFIADMGSAQIIAYLKGEPPWVAVMDVLLGVALTAVAAETIATGLAVGFAVTWGLEGLSTGAVLATARVATAIGISKLASTFSNAVLFQTQVNNVIASAASTYDNGFSGAPYNDLYAPVPVNPENWAKSGVNTYNLIDRNTNIAGSIRQSLSQVPGVLLETDFSGANGSGAVIAQRTIYKNGSTTQIEDGQTYYAQSYDSTANDDITMGTNSTIVINAKSNFAATILNFKPGDSIIIRGASAAVIGEVSLQANVQAELIVYNIAAHVVANLGTANGTLANNNYIYSPYPEWQDTITLKPPTPAPAPTSVNVPSGTTSLQLGQDNGDTFVLAGKTSTTAPTLEFLGTGGAAGASSNTANAISVTGAAGAPAYGDIKQDAPSTLVDTNGFQVSQGALIDTMATGSALTLNGNSTIGPNGAFSVGNAAKGAAVALNGTITLGALGTNTLDLSNAQVSGTGSIVIQGENDTATLDNVSQSTVAITSGLLKLASLADFSGIIGPASSASGANAIGALGQVDVLGLTDIASATFTSATGVLDLLNSAGVSQGSLQFSGNATALRLSEVTGSSGGYLAITDGPGTSAIHIAFG